VAQHDYVIANGTGAAVRSDLNNALAAIVSQNSGATEPATMYAYQWWADTSTGLLKLRNAANNAWITLRELDGTLTIEAGTVSAPGLAFASDLNTGIYSPSADQLAIATNGVERVEWGTTAVVFNDGGANYDFRIEGDTVDSLFFVDASADAVGLGTSTPNSPFEVGTLGINLDGAIAALPSSGADSAAFIARTASTGSAPFDQAGSIIYRPRVSSTAGRSSHIFYTGSPSAIRMVINEAGNVGIGTSSPSELLSLSSSTGSNIRLERSGTTVIASDNYGTISWFGNDATAGASGIRGSIQGLSRGSSGQLAIIFSTADSGGSNTERMRIEAGGNVGIGTTSPSSNLHVQTGNGVTATLNLNNGDGNGTISQINLGYTADPDHGNITYDGNLMFKNAANTERMRIDSSGRLLVGTSSEVSSIAPSIQTARSGAGFMAIANSDTVTAADTTLGQIGFYGKQSSAYCLSSTITASSDAAWSSSSDTPSRLTFSTTADGASSPTERMRIKENGQVWINSTANIAGTSASTIFQVTATGADFSAAVANTNATPYGLLIRHSTAANNTGSEFLYCSDSSALRASIRSNGGLANFSANNVNLSDRNAKKDIAPAAGTWDCLKEWEIVNFRYKDQPDDADLNMGVIAQQVAESCPEVITVFQEAKEATETEPAQEERLGVKDQQMMWMAIKALQEAQLRIETLEAEVAALKAQ
jgi:hypothetical protein